MELTPLTVTEALAMLLAPQPASAEKKKIYWVCPNGQRNREKDLFCWDTPCGCNSPKPIKENV